MMSRSTRSKGCSLIISSASQPFSATEALWPSACRRWHSISWFISLSSTTSTELDWILAFFAVIRVPFAPSPEIINHTLVENPKFEFVGVGIMVAHNPLHGSGRAVLLHPALALGNNAKAVPGIRVTDANLRKPTGHMALHPSPRQVSSLTTPFEYAPPNPTHRQSKVADRYHIHGHSIVPHVASHHRAQVPTHLWKGLVHALPTFFFDLLQLRLPSPAHRLPQH